MVMIFGWLSADAVRASLSKRRSRSSLVVSSLGRSLTAQLLIPSAGLQQIGGPLVRSTLESRVEELLDLLPTISLHCYLLC
jgi:hypothetical protein